MPKVQAWSNKPHRQANHDIHVAADILFLMYMHLSREEPAFEHTMTLVGLGLAEPQAPLASADDTQEDDIGMVSVGEFTWTLGIGHNGPKMWSVFQVG